MDLPVIPPHVAEAFERFPPDARERLFELRAIIFDVARARPEVGQLTETLKWGEPAYVTEETRSGSTVRLGWKSAVPDEIYLYVNCRTNLVESFRDRWDEDLKFVGNRAVALAMDAALPRAQLRACVEAALTYHLRPKRPRT